jgi:hypothetical protein
MYISDIMTYFKYAKGTKLSIYDVCKITRGTNYIICPICKII